MDKILKQKINYMGIPLTTTQWSVIDAILEAKEKEHQVVNAYKEKVLESQRQEIIRLKESYRKEQKETNEGVNSYLLALEESHRLEILDARIEDLGKVSEICEKWHGESLTGLLKIKVWKVIKNLFDRLAQLEKEKDTLHRKLLDGFIGDKINRETFDPNQ